MSIAEWIYDSIQMLEAASIPTPKLDAELLLSHLLEVDRSWLVAHGDDELVSSLSKKAHTLQELQSFLKRRTQHEPIAYIRGKQEFFGRDFIVTADTLTPRPESETIVILLLDELKRNPPQPGSQYRIIDVGTGTGCLIISAAREIQKSLHLPNGRFEALDISNAALDVAKRNAAMHRVDISFKHVDLTSHRWLFEHTNPRDKTYILANLPYVPTSFPINLAARHEPALALYGGSDGLDYYRVLFEKLSKLKHCTVLTESLQAQHADLETYARQTGFQLQKTADLIQVFKR